MDCTQYITVAAERKKGQHLQREEREAAQYLKRPHKLLSCTGFLDWATERIRGHKWSLDACVGYARLHGLFAPDEMVCTHTLYNEVWAGNLSLKAAATSLMAEACGSSHDQGS